MGLFLKNLTACGSEPSTNTHNTSPITMEKKTSFGFAVKNGMLDDIWGLDDVRVFENPTCTIVVLCYFSTLDDPLAHYTVNLVNGGEVVAEAKVKVTKTPFRDIPEAMYAAIAGFRLMSESVTFAENPSCFGCDLKTWWRRIWS